MSVPAPTHAGVDELEAHVSAFVDRTVAVAREKEREDLVGRLCAEARRTDEATVSVVVAGEAKRGKSSLVNALLAADLSPVDAAPATNAHIVLQHAPSTSVRVYHDSSPLGEEVSADELPQWVTAVGNPRNAKHVRLVEIGLDDPLLAQGVTLVDTPGVGGLDAAHADVTLAALSTADVLVFVVDASAPISDRELSFLARVTERIGNVLFVLTKIDAYAGADEIAADNRRLLAATRFVRAPLFQVSSARKRRADELDDTASDLRRRLLDLSGFAELQQALLDHTVGRRKTLRLANVVQLGRIVLERLDESERAVIEGATGDSALKDQLEDARARAQALGETRRIGSSLVPDELTGLQDELATRFERALVELELRHQHGFGKRGMKLETLPERLDAELNALVAQLNASLAEGVSEIVVGLADTLALEGFGTIDLDPAEAAEVLSVPVRPLASRTAIETMLDTTRAMRGMYVPERLLGGLTAVAFGGPVGPVVGIVAGLAVVGVTLVKSARVRDQRQAEGMLAEAVRTARREIPPLLRARVRELRRQVEETVYQAIKLREGELAAAIREHEQMAKEDARTQKRAAAAAANRRAVLKRLREDAEALVEGLAAARPPTTQTEEA